MIRWAQLLMCLAHAALAATPWTADDLWNLHTPAEPSISPDGHRVVYLDAWNDRAADLACANLRLLTIGDKQSSALTEGPWRDRSPLWSPDSSRIAWISGHGGIRVRTLAAAQETAVDAVPLNFAWSADSRWLAFTAAAPPQNRPATWAPAEILRLLVPFERPVNALYVVPATGGPARRVTANNFDVDGQPAWMPDGKSILVASTDGAIYFVTVAGGATRRLNTEPGRQSHPLPAPNGSKIAWMAVDSKPQSYSVHRLFVMNADGSRVKTLAGALDRDPERPQWSSESRTIYFTADDAGSSHVFASRADTSLRQVTNAPERLAGFSLSDTGRAVAVRIKEHAVDLVSFVVDLPSTPNVLVSPDEQLMAARDTGAVEEIHFPSAGKSIQGWLTKPPGFDAQKKYPLLLDIADAPRRMFDPGFSLPAQTFAARGWLVLRVNPRGTPGYGEEFGRLLPSSYPGDDADDLLAAIDAMASREFVDPKRLAIRGGLVAAWILGHSDRFAAAVIRRPIVDLAAYAASAPENFERALSWLGTTPWDDPDRYAHRSPLSFLKDWKTPALVIAEGQDPQATELLSALTQRKVDASMIRVDATKPSGHVQALEAALDWLDHR